MIMHDDNDASWIHGDGIIITRIYKGVYYELKDVIESPSDIII